MEFLIPILVFASVALVAVAFLPGNSANINARLSPYQFSAPLTERDEKLEQSLVTRLIWPFIHKLVKVPARLAPQRAYDEARKLMEQADHSMDLNLFMGLRAGGMIGLPLVYIFVMGFPTSIPSLGLVGLLGWFGGRLPINWLRKKAAARQKAIQRALPDTLDLITVSVEAGLALEAALAKVVEKTRGPLRHEIGRVLQEVGLGKSRRLALRDMAERCDVADLTSFVTAMVQAEQMGLGVAEVLRTQSDETRLRRRQRAEETAEKAPIKMLFPLIMCILPALLVVILGPAGWAIYKNLISSNAFGGL
jgi:tight adherence protein C